MKPTLYMYNLHNEKGRQLELLCVSQGILCKHVDAALYNQPIGYVTIEGFPASDTPAGDETFEDEMLIFKEFTQEQIGTFLSQCRQANIPPTPLKAGLTPTNIHWTSIQLHKELQEEHRAFTEQKA